jgi:hypothetical protein
MKKLRFKININGELVKVTGIDVDGTIHIYLSMKNNTESREQDIYFRASASLKNESYLWISQDLKEEDEINIRIVSDEEIDDPIEIKPFNESEFNDFVLKSKLKSY